MQLITADPGGGTTTSAAAAVAYKIAREGSLATSVISVPTFSNSLFVLHVSLTHPDFQRLFHLRLLHLLDCLTFTKNNNTMMSPVEIVMSIFAILIISSKAATIKDYEEFPGSNIVKGMCPTVGLIAAEYRVTVITETSSDSLDVGGCASIDFKSPDIAKKSFSLWIGSLKNGMQRCRENDMEQFNFTCVALSQSEDFMRGIMFSQLLGQVNNKESKQRCAIHDMVNGNGTMFRIAVSGNDSCHGLADLLQSNLQTTIPDGAMVLQLNRIRLVSNQLRSRDSTSHGYGHSNVINHFSGSWVNKL